MGGSNKTPSETQTFQQMPQSQALTTAQNYPGPYDIANDPFNYTGFTQYDNLSPVTGYDWWAPGNPQVTQNLPGGGTVITNSTQPQRTRRLSPGADWFANANTPPIGRMGTPYGQSTSALSNATPNFSSTAGTQSPALQAYLQMMGGTNNYGGIIGQQQQSANQPPSNTPPPASTNPANTRYGTWQPSESGGSYIANLPWGLTASAVGGSDTTGLRSIGETGLQWDINAGQVVGGDQQLDAYRSQWQPGGYDFGTGRGGLPYPYGQATGGGGRPPWMADDFSGFSTDWSNVPGTTRYPLWWNSANDPNATMPGQWSLGADSESTFNPGPGAFQSQGNYWLMPETVANYAPGGAPATPFDSPSDASANLNTNIPSGNANIPSGNANIPSGNANIPSGGVGQGSGPSGYGMSDGRNNRNPWGSLNDVAGAMTNASSFGGQRWRRG